MGSVTMPVLGKQMPLQIGPIHFVGIGGIGMSGIARILHGLGYQVQGSDLAESYVTEKLAAAGILVTIGHRAENLGAARVVVISSAVQADNPEVVAAREQRIPVVKRAEMLAEIMRLKACVAIAGTHGKTTTTALTAAMFEAAGLQPTVINGGIINAYDTNAHWGGGEWMVVEADESDGTFTKLPATIGVITNIDPEHLEHYGSFDGVRAAFATFLTNLPFYGFAAVCIDHPEVQALLTKVTDRRICTYGFSPQADVRAVNHRVAADGQYFDVEIDAGTAQSQLFTALHLPMHGRHNVSNALAAMTIAHEMQFGQAAIRKALAQFGGVKRRFTHTGDGLGMRVIDDYGHHPVEIAATLKAAREVQDVGTGRVIAVAQPHRYTRVHDLWTEFTTCFNDADIVLISDIYSAGETPIEGVTAQALCEALRAAGHKQVHYLAKPETLAATLSELGAPGDMIVCLGAGSITKWAYALPAQLQALAPQRKKA